MKRTLWILISLTLLSAHQALAEGDRAVERGRYLVTLMGCNDCHTPKTMGPDGPTLDATRLLSGHSGDADAAVQMAGGMAADVLRTHGWCVANNDLTAWAGDWGISFAINLTPDEDTGIGTWSEQMFIQTIRTGRHMGEGRPILPPMPWMNYAEATDEDLAAVFAYLRTLTPIENRVPEPVQPMSDSTTGR